MHLLPRPAYGSSTNAGWKADYIVRQICRLVTPLIFGGDGRDDSRGLLSAFRPFTNHAALIAAA